MSIWLKTCLLTSLCIASFSSAQAPAGPGPRRAGAGTADPEARGFAPQMREFFQALPADERQRLRELQQTDPEAFRDEFRRQLRKRHRQGDADQTDPQRDQIQRLAQQYHQAETEAGKAELRTQLRQAIVTNLQERLAERQLRLEQMENELQRIRAFVAERRQNIDKIADSYLDKLLQPPHLRWDGELPAAPER